MPASPSPPSLPKLLAEIRACTRCADHLPLGPRPVLQVGAQARILIAGQAPGRKVHETGIAFNDASGDRLRQWLGMPRDVFYDTQRVAIAAMGFCYPGTGPFGDLPPRPECAPAWRAPLLAHLKHVELTLVIGRYAQVYHLPDAKTVTEAVRNWRQTLPHFIALPHPSPRNQLWLRRNPWFEEELLPVVQARVRQVLREGP